MLRLIPQAQVRDHRLGEFAGSRPRKCYVMKSWDIKELDSLNNGLHEVKVLYK